MFDIFWIISFKYLSETKLCKGFKRKDYEFYPLRFCQRSNKTVVVSDEVETLEMCAQQCWLYRGLAFNFSPKQRWEKILYKTNEKTKNDKLHNCEVLECLEHRNFSSLFNDTRFDYYSLYTRPSRKFMDVNLKFLNFQNSNKNFICSKRVKTYHVFHLQVIRLSFPAIIQKLIISVQTLVETWSNHL